MPTARKLTSDEYDTALRVLLDGSPDVILVHRGGCVLFANVVALRTLGYGSVDEVAGRPIDALVTEPKCSDPAGHDAGLGAETRLRRRDGTTVPVQVTVIPLLVDAVPATLLHARDLTMQKALEAQVLAMNHIASAGHVGTVLAHEINNPLTYVAIAAEALSSTMQREGLDAEAMRVARGLVTEIRTGVARIAEIVRDVQTLSRDTEKLYPVALRDVVDSCLRMARSRWHDRAQVIVDVPGGLRVLGTESRVAQVVTNLVVNAAQAMAEGKRGTIRLTARETADAVVLDVADDGRGIAPEIRPHLFEMFFTTKGAAGNGVGLPVVHAVLASIGGTIALDSELGRGTTARVTFRRA